MTITLEVKHTRGETSILTRWTRPRTFSIRIGSAESWSGKATEAVSPLLEKSFPWSGSTFPKGRDTRGKPWIKKGNRKLKEKRKERKDRKKACLSSHEIETECERERECVCVCVCVCFSFFAGFTFHARFGFARFVYIFLFAAARHGTTRYGVPPRPRSRTPLTGKCDPASALNIFIPVQKIIGEYITSVAVVPMNKLCRRACLPPCHFHKSSTNGPIPGRYSRIVRNARWPPALEWRATHVEESFITKFQ